jgi:hypothetical protein
MAFKIGDITIVADKTATFSLRVFIINDIVYKPTDSGKSKRKELVFTNISFCTSRVGGNWYSIGGARQSAASFHSTNDKLKQYAHTIIKNMFEFRLVG